jgi:hypothetical protein
MRSRASPFKWEYPLLSVRSSSSFLRLLHRLPVTSIPPFIFPSVTCCRRQFLRKMWPIQLAFRLLISCMWHPKNHSIIPLIFRSLWLNVTYPCFSFCVRYYDSLVCCIRWAKMRFVMKCMHLLLHIMLAWRMSAHNRNIWRSHNGKT